MRVKVIRTISRWSKAFIDVNIACSKLLIPTHIQDLSAFHIYSMNAQLLLRHPDVLTVLDVGAGPKWKFPQQIKQQHGFRLIGVDIDHQSLAANEALDEFHVCDVCEHIPCPTNSVCLITAQSVVEHLHNVESFLQECARVLRPAGKAIFIFPGRLAPFALMNKLLPESLKSHILQLLRPQEHSEMGYPAFYNKSTLHEFRKSAEVANLRLDRSFRTYYSFGYFQFFIPFFMAALFIDHVRYLVGRPDAASYYVVLLSKPADGNP